MPDGWDRLHSGSLTDPPGVAGPPVARTSAWSPARSARVLDTVHFA